MQALRPDRAVSRYRGLSAFCILNVQKTDGKRTFDCVASETKESNNILNQLADPVTGNCPARAKF